MKHRLNHSRFLYGPTETLWHRGQTLGSFPSLESFVSHPQTGESGRTKVPQPFLLLLSHGATLQGQPTDTNNSTDQDSLMGRQL